MQDLPDSFSGRGKGQPVQASHARGQGSFGNPAGDWGGHFGLRRLKLATVGTGWGLSDI